MAVVRPVIWKDSVINEGREGRLSCGRLGKVQAKPGTQLRSLS